MMLRCNLLLAIAVVCVGTVPATATEPGTWTITVAPYTGAIHTISVPAPGTASPILLDQNEATGLSEDAADREDSKDFPQVRPDSLHSVVHASAASDSEVRRVVDPAEYRRVYALIPFSRAEIRRLPRISP